MQLKTISDLLINKSYRFIDIEKLSNDNDYQMRFEGKDLYSEGEPSEVLILEEPNNDQKIALFIYDGHLNSTGAVYKRLQ